MLNILLLQPTRPTNPPALRAQADALLVSLLAANPLMAFEIHQDEDIDGAALAPSPKYASHAAVRNEMLNRYLSGAHDYVLWIDSDLVAYDADLPMRLYTANPDGISAPVVTLDRCGDRFYDIGGFIEHGQRARLFPPWFDQPGPIYELDSVGCCYLVPAWLYRDGVRYVAPSDPQYVEHWSVMREAKARGLRIVALENTRAVHAFLPAYGLPLN